MKKRFLFILFCICAGLVACNEVSSYMDDDDDMSKYGIFLDHSRLSFFVGEKKSLVATVNFKTAYYGDVVWFTSDPAVATVSGEGEVTAVSLGKTTVSAMAAGETAECQIMVFPEESVFIAGYDWTEENNYTTRVWRNGEVVFEISNENPYVCTASDAGDVYAVYRNGSVILENGMKIFELDGGGSRLINTVLVPDDGNIYVGGKRIYDNGGSDAMIWENGSYFFTANYDSEIYSLFFSNGSVYAGGWTGNYPAIWRDGMKINIELARYAVIRSVFVSDNEIYAVGHDGYNAVLWENGDIKTVFDGPSEAYSVYKYGDDVYIGGAMNNYPAVWKNGELIFTGKEYGLIRTIDISDGDVYAAGYEGDPAKVWKNGEVFFEYEGNGPEFTYVRVVKK